MTEYVEYIPKNFPVDLLEKDWSKRKLYLRENEIEGARKLHDLEVREDDIWLVTLPHSGDKYMEELIWLISNNYDFESAKKKENLNVRTLHFELNENLEQTLDLAEILKSPRLISTHLPLPMLPAQLWRKKPKLIYVYRDPTDAQVSFYLKNLNMEIENNKSIEEFFTDNMDQSSSFEHVTEFYALRNEPWVYYTSFEQIMSNLPQVITQVVEFFEKSITDSQMERMLQYFSNDGIKKLENIYKVLCGNNALPTYILDNSKNGTSNMGKIWRKIKRVFERKRFQNDEKIGISKIELSPEFFVKNEKWIEDELNKYNVTLQELLLIDNEVNQKSEELGDKDNIDNEIFKKRDRNEKGNEEVVRNDSNDKETKSFNENEESVEKASNIMENSKKVEVEKKDIIDNAEVGKKDLNGKPEIGKNDTDNAEVEKDNNTNGEIEKKNSNALPEITNDAKFEVKDNRDNAEVEKNESENIEIKENNDTKVVHKLKSNFQKEESKDKEGVELENSNSSENVKMKDIEDDNVEKKENNGNEEESTYL